MYQEIELPSGPLLEKAGKLELERFRLWFMAMVETRPVVLERFVRRTPGFERWSCDHSEGSLTGLEVWLSDKIRSSRGPNGPTMTPVTHPGDLVDYLYQPCLTSQSYSVLYDCGFYLGEMLRRNIPGADWFQIRAGGRKFIDFGHVVLGPFEMYNFNPVRLMTSKGFAHIDQPDREQSLIAIFEHWKAKTVLARPL